MTNKLDFEKLEHKIAINKIHHDEGGDEQKVCYILIPFKRKFQQGLDFKKMKVAIHKATDGCMGPILSSIEWKDRNIPNIG